MAVRKYYFIAGAETLSPSMITRGGVQGEHNATEIIFKMDSSLISALNELTAEGKTFHYRFDGYDGAGGKISTQPISFVPGETGTETEFSYSLEHQLTKYGGTVQILFVITLVDGENTEVELYSYSVKMALKALPTGKDTEKEEYESISTLAVITKENAEKAAEASASAIEAQGKTEDARAALEGYSEWVFDGGDASGSVDIDLVIDDEMSGTSNNLVPNKVIKQYVDNLFASIYPIGSIYMSANDTSPSVLFGGEWERIKDRFLLSAGDIYESGLIGGEAEHTLTVEEMPGHSHSGTPKYYRAASVSAGTEENAQTGTQGWTGETGGNQPHNNMPPYLTVYMWKRIA